MISTLLISILVSAATLSSRPDDIIASFQNPSKSARPYVWWHWMDGEVSLDGIKKDLEWMDAVGIAGFHQFDAGGVNMPKAAPFKRPYLSESWKEAFRYAVAKADSLGMEMTVASAPGWSSTGGPWVSPEDAMKKLEWQTVEVNGGKIDVQLPELQKITGPYRDIARNAEHVSVDPYGYDIAIVAVLLPKDDGRIRSVTVHMKDVSFRPREGSALTDFKLQCSNDGKRWKDICAVPKSPLQYITFNIPPTKAKHFRVTGDKVLGLELSCEPKVNHFEEKAGYCFPYDFKRFDTAPVADKFCIKSADVVDLTSAMNTDGHLTCTLPAGRWRIYRFGASLTGKMNHPASPNATGLEVDKLDKDAWTRYFHKYLDMYKEAAGGMLGEKGITHLLVDSYEAGSETWTATLPQEFRARRGYDLLPWMPVLAGEIIESPERSEAFLFDWRKTLSELFEENYQRINEIIAAYGMKGTYIESHETGRAFVGDGMAVKQNATVPQSAIWVEDSPSGSMIPSAISDIRESASVAHIYGQNIAAAESFTANGDGKRAYTYHPGNLKRVADMALASGLNRFVIHDSASQPSDDYLPGLALFRYGQWFHRNETWAPYAKVWTDYLARSCQMLQLGRNVADILLFYGEDTNATAEYGGEYLKYLPKIPAGYNFDYANADVLLNAVRVDNRNLVSDSGQRYRILVLGAGARKNMSEMMDARIASFIAEGVTVCYEEELVETLKLTGLQADVEIAGNESFIYGGAALKNQRGHDCCLTGIQFVHREIPSSAARNGSGVAQNDNLYWFCNFTQKVWEGEIKLRDGGKYAAVLNADDGSAVLLPEGGNSLKLKLKAGDAVFVLMTDVPLDIPAAKPEYMNSTILTLERWWDVEFNQRGGEKAVETFSVLNDWTTNSDPVIKYYSGTAHYSSSFNVPAGALAAFQEAKLDLGTVNVMAELIINGHSAGVLWREPYISADILPWLKEGDNTIEVNVTNLWVNRMIGDRQRGEKPVTNVRRFYTAGDKLLPSGLLGPVKLIGYKEK